MPVPTLRPRRGAYGQMRQLMNIAKRQPARFATMARDAGAVPIVKSKRDLRALCDICASLPARASLRDVHPHWRVIELMRDVDEGAVRTETLEAADIVAFYDFCVTCAPHADDRLAAFMDAIRSVECLALSFAVGFTLQRRSPHVVKTALVAFGCLAPHDIKFILGDLGLHGLASSVDWMRRHVAPAFRRALHAFLDREEGGAEASREAAVAILDVVVGGGDELVDVALRICRMHSLLPHSTWIVSALRHLRGRETTTSKAIVAHLPPVEILRVWTPDCSIESALFDYAERNGSWPAYLAFCNHDDMRDVADAIRRHLPHWTKDDALRSIPCIRARFEASLHRMERVDDLQTMLVLPVCSARAVDETRDRLLSHDAATCPISLGAIVLPVRDAHGRVYERDYILSWLARHQTNPFTREPMTHDDLCLCD